MKTIRGTMLLATAALALAACGKKTETVDTNVTATTTDTVATNDVAMAGATVTGGQAFANMAAASDAFEIATSQAVLATSTSAAVKKYAKAMVDAHTASTAKLKSTAAALSPAIVPDATLSAAQQQKLDALKTKTGADLDRAYIEEQTAAHQETLDGLKAYAATGDVPALKTFASGLVPTVTAHLNMAKALKA